MSVDIEFRGEPSHLTRSQRNIIAQMEDLRKKYADAITESRKYAKEGEKVFKATASSAELYSHRLEKLNNLLAKGAISQEQFNRARRKELFGALAGVPGAGALTGLAGAAGLGPIALGVAGIAASAKILLDVARSIRAESESARQGIASSARPIGSLAAISGGSQERFNQLQATARRVSALGIGAPGDLSQSVGITAKAVAANLEKQIDVIAQLEASGIVGSAQELIDRVQDLQRSGRGGSQRQLIAEAVGSLNNTGVVPLDRLLGLVGADPALSLDLRSRQARNNLANATANRGLAPIQREIISAGIRARQEAEGVSNARILGTRAVLRTLDTFGANPAGAAILGEVVGGTNRGAALTTRDVDGRMQKTLEEIRDEIRARSSRPAPALRGQP